MPSLCHAFPRSSSSSWPFLCALAALLYVGCTSGSSGAVERQPVAQPSAQATEQPAEGPRVVFLGDSISAGLHLDAEQAFPAVLQRKLAGKGVPFQLSNAGVSGDTTAGGLRRTDWVLRQRPEVVVVELGANDGLRGVELSTVEKNLRAIIAKIRGQGAKVLLLGMRLPPSYGAEYTRGFEAMYARLADELNVPSVPFFMRGVAGIPELNLEDGLHPTAEGHERLADNVADALTKLLRSTKS